MQRLVGLRTLIVRQLSASLYPDWDRLKSQRIDFDAEIMRWAEGFSATGWPGS
jgi:hypothetical protein